MDDVKNTKYKLQGQCTYCKGPCKASAKRCMACREKQIKQALIDKQTAREKARQALLDRPCKHCGKPINTLDKRQVKCGLHCSGTKKVVTCDVCGKPVEKYKSQIGKFRINCCSDDCQRVWAGKCGKDWEQASIKARKRWTRERRKQRRKNNKWLCSIARKLSCSTIENKDWKYRIRTRLSSANGRKRKGRNRHCKPSGSVLAAIRRIESKRKYFELSAWQKKIGNKLSNVAHRRRRKVEIKRIKGRSDLQETRGVWVQLCFDWLEDQPRML